MTAVMIIRYHVYSESIFFLRTATAGGQDQELRFHREGRILRKGSVFSPVSANGHSPGAFVNILVPTSAGSGAMLVSERCLREMNGRIQQPALFFTKMERHHQYTFSPLLCSHLASATLSAILPEGVPACDRHMFAFCRNKTRALRLCFPESRTKKFLRKSLRPLSMLADIQADILFIFGDTQSHRAIN